jgi:hypothetical protein
MKHHAKLMLFAILSLTIGVAFASPLLVAELNIKPFIKHVQGSTAEFSVDAVYANFTILDGTKPVSEFDGPAIEYYIVLNVTNLSDIGAKLLDVNFVAAEKITNASTSSILMNGVSGVGYEVEGAWVDGVWYNVTYVTGDYPTIGRDGNVIVHSFLNSSWFTPYWMEGVQILDTYANGTLTGTYMNMNGTWTNVIDRINFTRPHGVSPLNDAVAISNTVISELHLFQAPMPSDTTETNTSGNDTSTDSNAWGLGETEYTWVGEGLFDNYWAPHQSRLIVLQGTRDIIKPFASAKTLDALKSGSLTLKTRVFNNADVTVEIVDNTVADTWSYATELKQVQLAQSGDSYIYNAILGENQFFVTDSHVVEVFIETRR